MFRPHVCQKQQKHSKQWSMLGFKSSSPISPTWARGRFHLGWKSVSHHHVRQTGSQVTRSSFYCAFQCDSTTDILMLKVLHRSYTELTSTGLCWPLRNYLPCRNRLIILNPSAPDRPFYCQSSGSHILDVSHGTGSETTALSASVLMQMQY